MNYTKLMEFYLREEETESEQNTYNMKYVNGGFSNSVDIQPGIGQDSGKVNVSINIFGGGEKKKVSLPTPPKIQRMMKAYEIALKNQDASAENIKLQLEKYYADLKMKIGSKFVQVMQEMDAKAKNVLIHSIKEINNEYQ